jgi:hypothetical protein
MYTVNNALYTERMCIVNINAGAKWFGAASEGACSGMSAFVDATQADSRMRSTL